MILIIFSISIISSMSHWLELKRNYNIPSLKNLSPHSNIWHMKLHKMNTKKLILKDNEKIFNEGIVHNFSDYQFSTDEHKLLTKGLNFSPKIDSCRLKSPKELITNKLNDTLNKKLYAAKNQNRTYTRHPFNNRKWTPETDNPHIKEFINELTNTQMTDYDTSYSLNHTKPNCTVE